MKILITGGSGFIGSHLADHLLARGDQILVIDNFATGLRRNLTPHPNLRVVEGSISDFNLMNELMQSFKPNLVVHAAASYKDPSNWIEDSLTNVMGTAIVCQTAQKAGVSRIIYFQTALCYGLKPIEQPITLEHPILPGGSSYAISKTAGEEYVHLSGLNYVTFRLANVYGPRNISGPLPTFYKRLSSNQRCFTMDTRRDFVYIDDLITCVLAAIDGKGSGTYHISSGKDYSIQELYDATVKAMNLNVLAESRQRNEDDVFSIFLDPARTRKDFGWAAKTPLEQGIEKTISDYKQFGIEETYTHLKQETTHV